jgi:hypothetical protein
MKTLLLIVGMLAATAGGVITYRALYVEPKSAVVITDDGDIRQLPNYARVIGGAPRWRSIPLSARLSELNVGHKTLTDLGPLR